MDEVASRFKLNEHVDEDKWTQKIIARDWDLFNENVVKSLVKSSRNANCLTCFINKSIFKCLNFSVTIKKTFPLGYLMWCKICV